jgi:hypothetical protein
MMRRCRQRNSTDDAEPTDSASAYSIHVGLVRKKDPSALLLDGKLIFSVISRRFKTQKYSNRLSQKLGEASNLSIEKGRAGKV